LRYCSTFGRQLAEAADRGEPGEVGREQVEGRVDVAVDEVLHLVAVELRDEVDVAQVALRLGGPQTRSTSAAIAPRRP
jgi:hypothetical protein